MIKNYISYLTFVKQYSKATIINYTKGINRLQKFLTTIGKDVNDPEGIRLVDMFNFLEDMAKSWLSARTCAGHLYGVVSYLKYCRDVLELHVLDIAKIQFPKIPDRKVWYFSEDEKNHILKLANNWLWFREETRLRNRLIVYLFLHTGLRCHEIAKIKLSDIVGESLQVIGKGGKRRFVFLRKEILDMIYLYLGKRKRKSDYLFHSWLLNGGHITTDQIRHTFNKMSKKAWIHIHAHKFRHTFATDLLHVPWSNIYAVARLLGHQRITTTQIYLGTNNAELKKIQFWLKF